MTRRRLERSTELNVRVAEPLMKTIEEICEEQGISKAAFVRSAIQFYLRDLEMRKRFPGYFGTTLPDSLLDDKAFLDKLAAQINARRPDHSSGSDQVD